MAQFFLIDPSWRGFGDHHGEFGSALVRAALARQIPVRVAVHRDFDPSHQVLSPAEVVPLFRETSYQAASVLAGLQAIKRGGWARPQPPQRGFHWLALKSSLQNRAAERRHVRYARHYADSLAEFFAGQSFDATTTVLFATASDLDFAGIGAYLRATPNTIQAQWHFLFHFNLFHGRPPSYEQQRWRLTALRERFISALQGLPYHQLHFHTTTEQLADQYNRLQIARFSVFPYPVIEETSATTQFNRVEPLRFSCLGAVRREKQQGTYLQSVVDHIWDSHLATGRVKLHVQTVKSTWFRRPKIKLILPDGRMVDSSNSNGTAVPISFVPHPLPRQAYDKLLNETDCGLLLYDAETYFSRRAGILDELQVLGRPVIVSAGSWLADQLGSGQYQYTQQLADDPDRARPLNTSEMSFSTSNLPCEGGVLSFDEGRHPLEIQFETESDENAIALQFQWRSPLVSGTYVRVEIAPAATVNRDRPTDALPIAQCQIVGHAAKGLVPGVILRLPPGPPECRQFVVRVTNAYHDATVCIQNLRVTALKQFCGPLGYTGLAVADQSQLGGAIADIVEHYEHYRQAAAESATSSRREHDPHRVVDWLVATRQSSRRAA